jgi:hypothetical protein
MPSSPWRRIPLASIAGELTARIARLSFANLRRLDASNGRQNHTVLPYAASPAKNFDQPSAGQPKPKRKRLSAVRLRAMFTHGKSALRTPLAPDAAASTATRPNVRDDGQRPSSRDGMAGVVRVIWGRGEAEYFCIRGWTGQISLKFLWKIARPRTSIPPNGRPSGPSSASMASNRTRIEMHCHRNSQHPARLRPAQKGSSAPRCRLHRWRDLVRVSEGDSPNCKR